VVYEKNIRGNHFHINSECYRIIGTAKINFRSQNYVGLLEGDTGSSWQVQTINGFQTGTWFAGVGTGLDFYRYRTVPLFLSVNKSIKSTGNSFYFLSDGGFNFAWVDKEPRSRFNDYISDKFIPSLYWNGGIGYKAMIGKKEDAVLISLAYSYKRLKEEKEVACNLYYTAMPFPI
jgi:hypothetical protein